MTVERGRWLAGLGAVVVIGAAVAGVVGFVIGTDDAGGPLGGGTLTAPAPSATGEGSRAVEPVAAAEGGRADCAADWYVYNDPDGRFSLCYPEPLDARSEATPEQTTIVYLSTPLEKGASELAPNHVSRAIKVLLPEWRVDTSCEKAAADWGGVQVEAGALSLSGVEGVTCQGRGSTELWGHDPLQAFVPLGEDGTSLLIFAFKTGPDLATGAALVEEVLGTLAPGSKGGQSQ